MFNVQNVGLVLHELWKLSFALVFFSVDHVLNCLSLQGILLPEVNAK